MAVELAWGTVVFVSFPRQGHVIPMLRLAHILVDRVDVLGTIVVPDFIHRRMVGQHSDRGCPLSPYPVASRTTTISPFLYALEHYMPTQLEAMLMGAQGLLVASRAWLSWAIPVVERCGLQIVGRPDPLGFFRANLITVSQEYPYGVIVGSR
jgi:hypothetical protein